MTWLYISNCYQMYRHSIQWTHFSKLLTTPIKKQEALQMQRHLTTLHKYEILHLKKLSMGEWPSRTLKLITIAATG